MISRLIVAALLPVSKTSAKISIFMGYLPCCIFIVQIQGLNLFVDAAYPVDMDRVVCQPRRPGKSDCDGLLLSLSWHMSSNIIKLA